MEARFCKPPGDRLEGTKERGRHVCAGWDWMGGRQCLVILAQAVRNTRTHSRRELPQGEGF